MCGILGLAEELSGLEEMFLCLQLISFSFAYCFVWVLNLVSDIEGGLGADGV
jgi:hypothetical protein